VERGSQALLAVLEQGEPCALHSHSGELGKLAGRSKDVAKPQTGTSAVIFSFGKAERVLSF
jgi:hypothetical protein